MNDARPVAGPGFAGTTAIVTGGARGIGYATVAQLARLGVDVLALDKDIAPLIAAPFARNVSVIQIDTTDAEAMRRFFAQLDAERRAVRCLVNNVGGSVPCALADMSTANWDDTLALNLRSAFLATTGVLAAMRRHGDGAIVNVSSIAAHSISPVGGAAYAVAKAGLLALTRQTAAEWAGYRIRANAVCPGPTRTDLTRHSRRTAESFPLGRWVEPEDVAQAILYLLSDAAAMCTGAVIDVDGGTRFAASSARPQDAVTLPSPAD